MRIKLADRALPDYTKGEELFNTVYISLAAHLLSLRWFCAF